MKKYVSGIDEAGRGPAVGPLVMAAVTIDSRRLVQFGRWGVKDSKKISAKNRGLLYPRILKLVEKYQYRIITAEEINQHCLTDLCTETVAQFITKIPPKSKIFIDALGSLKKELFIKRIVLNLNLHYPTFKITDDIFTLNKSLFKRIVYEPYADDNYLVVAAASIIAKEIREREIIDWCKTHSSNRYVSGYPNQTTNKFIREYRTRYGTLPPGVRINWKNIKRIVADKIE